MSWQKRKKHAHNNPFALITCVTPICIEFIACECDFIEGADKNNIYSKRFYFMIYTFFYSFLCDVRI